jgi:hypothetical protein
MKGPLLNSIKPIHKKSFHGSTACNGSASGANNKGSAGCRLLVFIALVGAEQSVKKTQSVPRTLSECKTPGVKCQFWRKKTV